MSNQTRLFVIFAAFLTHSLALGATLNASMKLGFGYYTNAYHKANNNIDEQGNFTFRMKPAFDFVGDGKLAKLEINENATLDLVFGKQGQNQFVIDGDFSANGELNPHGSATAFASETITADSTVKALYVGSLTQLTQESQVGFKFSPANGPVTLKVYGQLVSESFLNIIEPTDGNTIDAASLATQHYSLHSKVSYANSKDLSFYVEANYGAWYGEGVMPVSVNPFRVDAGVKSQLSNVLSGEFNIGYARAFIRILANNTLVDTASVPIYANAKLDWQISDDSDLSLNLSRVTMAIPVFLDSYTNALTLNFTQQFEEKFNLQISPTVTWIEYGTKLDAQSTARVGGTARNDILLEDTEEVTYHPLTWLSCGVVHTGNYRWTTSPSLDIFDFPARRSGSAAANQLFLGFIGFSY